jgi:hypothetical protein
MPTFDNNVLDALSLPLGDLIAEVGRGVAEAQRAMDTASLAALRDIYESDEGLFRELQRIGYRPTWYHIPEAEGQIQVALSVAGTTATTASTPGLAPRIKLYAAPIDAGYTSRFNFNLQASSSVKFRIVPVPPSTAAEGLQVVPSLIGLALGEARSRLALLGIQATLPDAASATIVTTQTPAAGTLLATGETVTVGTA